jgi:hypothetical protein
MNTPSITAHLRLDAGPFIRSMHDATQAFTVMCFALRGLPKPPRKPYPKRHSLMTAREYRAARRAYARALRAHRKALR